MRDGILDWRLDNFISNILNSWKSQIPKCRSCFFLFYSNKHFLNINIFPQITFKTTKSIHKEEKSEADVFQNQGFVSSWNSKMRFRLSFEIHRVCSNGNRPIHTYRLCVEPYLWIIHLLCWFSFICQWIFIQKIVFCSYVCQWRHLSDAHISIYNDVKTIYIYRHTIFINKVVHYLYRVTSNFHTWLPLKNMWCGKKWSLATFPFSHIPRCVDAFALELDCKIWHKGHPQ